MNEQENKKKTFRSLYLWGILCVLLTYGYPVLWYVTLPKVGESVNSSAAYEAAAKAQNGALGSNLPFVFLVIPLVILVINLVIAVLGKEVPRKVFLNLSRLIKYALIPYYIAGGVIIALCILLMFTPVVIMVFVSPAIITVLSALGYLSLLGTAPFMIAYLSRGVKDGVFGKGFSFVMGFLQFIFGLDVLATLICAGREKRKAKDISSET